MVLSSYMGFFFLSGRNGPGCLDLLNDYIWSHQVGLLNTVEGCHRVLKIKRGREVNFEEGFRELRSNAVKVLALFSLAKF